MSFLRSEYVERMKEIDKEEPGYSSKILNSKKTDFGYTPL